MKKILLILVPVIVLALGGLYVRHAREESAAAAKAALKEELAAKAAALEKAEDERKRAEEQKEQLLALSDKLTSELKARQTSASTTNPPGAGSKADPAAGEGKEENAFGKLLSGMMQNPEIKKMIRDQQRGMVNTMYDPLVAKMNLSPEQAAQFKDLIADTMAKAAENAGALFGATNREEALQQISADQKTLDDQIRGLLGEDRYAQYRDYQDTVQERTQLNMFQQQLGNTPLSENQTEKLLTLMKEEKEAAYAATGLPGSGPGQEEANMRAMMSEEQTTKMIEAQEKANQKVYERAASVLSPEQLSSFGTFQTNQLGMMKIGLSMARQFMGGEKK